MKLEINSQINKNGINSGMYPVIIYQILRQYTNEDNPITINDICDTLQDYWKGDTEKTSSKKNIKKTIYRNLESLLYFDSNIQAVDKDGFPYLVESGESIGKIYQLWYEQELSLTDLHLLSDAVVYSKHLSNSSQKEILGKLMRIAGQPNASKAHWYNSILKNARDISIPVPNNLYRTMDYVNDAIENKNCISFDYSFSGPDAKRYKVQSYSGVSPYMIIQHNGIYYMIAANNKDNIQQKMHKDFGFAYPVLYLEIHKLDNISTDLDSKYLSIKETIGDAKTIKDFISGGYHPLTHEAFPNRLVENLKFRTSSRGLDILLDHFGGRLLIKKSPKIDKRYSGNTPELAYRYDITLKNAALNDWYELLPLLLSYSIHDIELVSPLYLLQGVMRKMNNRIDRLLNDKSSTSKK